MLSHYITKSRLVYSTNRLLQNNSGRGNQTIKTRSGCGDESEIDCWAVVISILLIIIIFMIVIVTIYMTVVKYQRKHTSTDCNSTQIDGQNKIHNITATLNLSVNPCENFYRYACDRYIENNRLLQNYTHWSPFDEILKGNFLLVQQSILNLTEEKLNSSKANCSHPTKNISLYKLRQFYDSCINLTTIDRMDSWPLLDLIQQLLPHNHRHGINSTLSKHGSHVKKQSPTKHFHRILTLSMKWNVPTLFQFVIHTDGRNSSREILQIHPPKLEFFNLTYYDDPGKIQVYRNYLRQVWQHLQSTWHTSISLMDLDDIIQIEQTIVKLMNNEKKKIQRIPIIKIQKELCSKVNWIEVLESIAQIKIASHLEVEIYNEDYFRNMCKLIEAIDKHVFSNFVVWRSISSFIPYLSTPLVKLKDDFTTAINGYPKSIQPRWKMCIKWSDENFGVITSSLFVQANQVKLEKIKMVEKIVNEIKTLLLSKVEESHWLGARLKGEMLTKIHGISSMIGFPEWILNDTGLLNQYSEVRVKQDCFFENIMNVKAFNFKAKLSTIAKPTEIGRRWLINIDSNNALYYRAWNSIGIKHDRYGNIMTWLDNDILKNYISRIQCFANQYSSYKLDEKHMNGNLTVSENIADSEGLKLAYKAYEINLNQAENSPCGNAEKNDFTRKQLFFIHYAQSMCRTSLLNYLLNFEMTELHSPNVFRVIGSLSNLHEFADVFDCQANSPMNPKDKCLLL
ncbi:uncharacterized protein TRIADDRAFT_55930 [Trichoplax adhaerens]|uniref:Peptidase M13 N-terminal domain-containing protein n=1 Tax=Trichoplax adhaerens TaxID=10228 RepID=B3RTH8_TRIAD|nr:hypothetical protein TRIADDRAFT_55930 [Trichoplax adhaerens]EDV26136.1 hypothetical protein TRIADDRAFT_55930 [Trichoplax adhaerens]|eukprot:XP_002112169.1 hypothetical protein TRIADDRAFT_55930 [Trichoplax adhaerens]